MAPPPKSVHLAQRRRRGHAPSTTVLVCRGCCCGTARKHPDVDHEAQLAAWRAAARGDVTVRATGCLGPCSASNVVAVRLPGDDRRLWLGGLLDQDVTDLVTAWIGRGCPLPLPPALASHQLGVVHPDAP
jgi:(2Fe-2S) ferredoxin